MKILIQKLIFFSSKYKLNYITKVSKFYTKYYMWGFSLYNSFPCNQFNSYIIISLFTSLKLGEENHNFKKGGTKTKNKSK